MHISLNCIVYFNIYIYLYANTGLYYRHSGATTLAIFIFDSHSVCVSVPQSSD